jgi:transposase-like protein
MKVIEKQKAIELRKDGESIKDIAASLGVAKSSVSVWVRNVKLSNKQISKLSKNNFSKLVVEKRRTSRIIHEEAKRDAIMFEASRDIAKISKHELRLMGLCLYWGEGGKTNQGVARISNSDPKIISIMMRFFREICSVEESKFRGHIHTYSHLNAQLAEEYWSSISKIPKRQFYKTYIKKSVGSQGKRDKLPYGTFDIYVCNTKLYLQIMGQIEKIKTILS